MPKRNPLKQKKNQPQPANPNPGQPQGGFFKPAQQTQQPGQGGQQQGGFNKPGQQTQQPGQGDRSEGQQSGQPDEQRRDQQSGLNR